MTSIARTVSQFSTKEIDNAFKHARRLLKTSSIILLYGPQKREYGRILVIASRKVGNAVIRNKFKRRIKNIFYQEHMYLLRHDFICITRPGIGDINFETLKKILTDAKAQTQSNPWQNL
jgi:ribonuclease P protein component